VNTASKLGEDIATGGAILISDAVRKSVEADGDHDFGDLDLQVYKDPSRCCAFLV